MAWRNVTALALASVIVIGAAAQGVLVHAANPDTIAPGGTFLERQRWRENKLIEIGKQIESLYDDFILDYTRTYGVAPPPLEIPDNLKQVPDDPAGSL